jgi:hypothetical protein
MVDGGGTLIPTCGGGTPVPGLAIELKVVSKELGRLINNNWCNS